MSVRIKGKALFLEHPRTGSTTIRTLLRLHFSRECKEYMRHERPDTDGDEFVFTTVRNPFDSMVSWWSMWEHRHRARGCETFADFLRNLPNSPLFMKEGKLFYFVDDADFVMRFEHLDRDFKEVLFMLQLPPIVHLPKRSASKRNPDYRTYYTPEDVALVSNLCNEEIARFGYNFEDGPRKLPDWAKPRNLHNN